MVVVGWLLSSISWLEFFGPGNVFDEVVLELLVVALVDEVVPPV
jgi:hypothetical protein